MTLDQVIARIRRALMLDPAVYEEIRDDTNFTLVSIGSAAVAVLLAAIGAWLFGETVLDPAPGLGFVDTVILGTQIGFAFGLASVAATFYYTIFGIRAAYPNVDNLRAMIAVLLGFAVWAVVIPIISDYPDNNWVTGVFVYSLID